MRRKAGTVPSPRHRVASEQDLPFPPVKPAGDARQVVRALTCGLLFAAHTVFAQGTEPTVTVELGVDRENIYQYETFVLTVKMVSSGVRLGKNLTLDGMPEADTLAMEPIETLPIQRSLQERAIHETRQYRARCRALKPGTLRLTPAAGAAQIVQRRSFFGRQWVENPIRLAVPPIEIPVSELPPPPAGVSPSGAVGTFSYKVIPERLDVAVGDLIKLRTRISGEGYLDGIACPGASPGAGFKVYPPRLTGQRSNVIEFEQILVPLNSDAAEIPPQTFTSFDARSGMYQTQTQGPYRITFHAKREMDRTQPYRSAGREEEAAPALTLADRIDQWKQEPPPRGKETVIILEPVTARLAPASVARALFTCKPGDIVVINEEDDAWISIQRKQDMGWIPVDAVMRRTTDNRPTM
ncbi:MAG: BatD family protein [Kiritimatiellae bacterium]|nr:BatD family protein [Kiritimatiellia bacterium]